MFIFKRSKILAILGLSLVLSSSSYARGHADNFFLKSIVSLSKLSDVREKHADMTSPLAQESSMMPSIGVGVGYYVDEDIRVDLMLESLYWSFSEQRGNFNDNTGGSTTFHVGTRTINRKASGTSLMLNGYLDVMEVNNCKIFLGAGAGVVQIKEKVNIATSGTLMSGGMALGMPSHVENASTKTARNISYSLIVGANMEINPQVSVELTYLWRNFGKIKSQETTSFTRSSNNIYRGHYLSVGLRYDI